ncbi:MAG: Nif3-like dinuclear metal center hexameric protein [Phycisphaerales bacterium]
MPTVAQLVHALNSIAPPTLAEPWDNVALLLGDPEAQLASNNILLTIDLTHAVLEEAQSTNAAAIAAYHPPIFTPIKSITPAAPKGELLLRAARAGIAIYSPHTALDAVTGGVNDWLLEQSIPNHASTIRHRRAITPHTPTPHAKLIFFTPRGTEDKLVDELSKAGAGTIGDYTNCSFQSHGTGTFLPGRESHPTIGRPGVYETVEETRVEMVVPRHRIQHAIAALRAHHSYEEPAFDIVMTHEHAPDPATGAGRIAELTEPITIDTIARTLRGNLNLRSLRIATPNHADPASIHTSTIAVCPGSGASLLEHANLEPPVAGCFITGEMSHHQVLAAVERGITIILAGHTNTERGYLPTYAKRIRETLPALNPTIATTDRWPLTEHTT